MYSSCACTGACLCDVRVHARIIMGILCQRKLLFKQLTPPWQWRHQQFDLFTGHTPTVIIIYVNIL